MTTIGARLNRIRGHRSQKIFAAELGIATSTFQNYERDERDIDASTLITLMGHGWSADWLLSGEGPERIGQVRVADGDPADYSPSQPVRQEAFIRAVQTIDEELAAKRAMLPPDKRARAYLLLADLLADEAELPNAKVIQLVLNAVA